MQIAIAKESDEERWNEYANNHAHTSPYHLFAWKKSVETAYGQKSYYLMALDAQDNIVGILPSILIKPPLGYATLCSLPYCDRGEALADTPVIVDELISEGRAICHKLKAHCYEYRSTRMTAFDSNKQRHTAPPQKVRMILDLPETSELLLAGFKSKLRSQIKKAEKNGLTFLIGNNGSQISDFYNVFATNMRDLGSPTHSKRWFECIRRFYGEHCIISVVKYDSQPVGAGLILQNGLNATIPWASTLKEYNKLAPNMLLYWSLLEYATNKGCQQFDFGRSSIGEGTFKFKQQWGARPVELDWVTYQDDGGPAVMDYNPGHRGILRQTAEHIWRKLPLPLSVRLGSSIRKYISL